MDTCICDFALFLIYLNARKISHYKNAVVSLSFVICIASAFLAKVRRTLNKKVQFDVDGIKFVKRNDARSR